MLGPYDLPKAKSLRASFFGTKNKILRDENHKELGDLLMDLTAAVRRRETENGELAYYLEVFESPLALEGRKLAALDSLIARKRQAYAERLGLGKNPRPL